MKKQKVKEEVVAKKHRSKNPFFITISIHLALFFGYLLFVSRSSGFMALAIICAPLEIIPVIVLGGMLVGLFKTQKALIIIFTLIFSACFGTFLGFKWLEIRTNHYQDQHIGEQNEAIGQSIQTALRQYKKRHGSYPDALNNLVPEELPSVPRTVDHKKFWYYHDPKKDSFIMGFPSVEDGRSFESNSGKWKVSSFN